MKSGNNSFWTKLMFVLSLFTAVSPIDALPDIIPILGQIDDAIAIPLMILLGVKMLYGRRQRRNNVQEESHHQEHRGFENAKYAGEDLGGESFNNPN